MSLKTVLETTDGLNEALIPFYTEQDGKFVLQIEGVREHPEVANLRVAYDREKESAKALKAEISNLKENAPKLPEDFDLEKWEKLKDGKADEAAQIKLRQEYEAKITDLEGKLTSTQETARKNALDRDLSDALNEAGVTNPSFAKAARTMLSDGVKIGEDGKPFVDTDMGPLALTDHVKRWAAGEGKAFVDPGTGGGGKGGSEGGSTGENPWKAESRNLMKQAEIVKTDPALAAQLKAAAGKS